MQIPTFGGAAFLYDACVAQRFDAAHIVALELLGVAVEKARVFVRDNAINLCESLMRTVQDRASQNTNGLFVAMAFNNLISRLGVSTAPMQPKAAAAAGDLGRNRFALGSAKRSNYDFSNDCTRHSLISSSECQSDMEGDGEWQMLQGKSNVENDTLVESECDADADRSNYLNRLVSPVSSVLRNAYCAISSRLSTPLRSANRKNQSQADETTAPDVSAVTDIKHDTVNATDSAFNSVSQTMDFEVESGVASIIDIHDVTNSMTPTKRGRRRGRPSHQVESAQATPLKTSAVEERPSSRRKTITTNEPENEPQLVALKEDGNIVADVVASAVPERTRRIPKASALKAPSRSTRRPRASQTEEVENEADDEQRSRSNSRSRIPRKAMVK